MARNLNGPNDRKLRPKPHTIIYAFDDEDQLFMTEVSARSAKEAIDTLVEDEGEVQMFMIFEGKKEWFDSRLVAGACS